MAQSFGQVPKERKKWYIELVGLKDCSYGKSQMEAIAALSPTFLLWGPKPFRPSLVLSIQGYPFWTKSLLYSKRNFTLLQEKNFQVFLEM